MLYEPALKVLKLTAPEVVKEEVGIVTVLLPFRLKLAPFSVKVGLGTVTVKLLPVLGDTTAAPAPVMVGVAAEAKVGVLTTKFG